EARVARVARQFAAVGEAAADAGARAAIIPAESYSMPKTYCTRSRPDQCDVCARINAFLRHPTAVSEAFAVRTAVDRKHFDVVTRRLADGSSWCPPVPIAVSGLTIVKREP